MGPQVTIHRLDPQLHEDLHKFLALYERSVNAKGEILDAVAKSQTALLNSLSLISSKIDGITPAPGGTVDLTRLKADIATQKGLREQLQAILAEQPQT